MKSHFGRWKWTWALAVMLALVSTFASAQGASSNSQLSGLVKDSSGGVIPGADVVAKNNATATEYRSVTDSAGRFTIPSINIGTYTVKVSLMGFKTWSAPDIAVTTSPSNLTAVLEIGNLEETVVVTGATELVQTQTATVQTTLSAQQIQQLPVITHTALDYVVQLPGIETPGSNTRSSTVNGLPRESLNITLDGINVQDNRDRGSEGFFMYIRPMMDSVEEVSVSTSNPGAESSGGGASNVRMVTRSGSNRFSGSAYNTWRNQAGTNSEDTITRKQKPGWLWGLNSPYYFNKAPSAYAQAKVGPNKDLDYINDVRLQTPGFRVGGPVLKDKLFYFFNYEEFRLPESRQRTWRVMNDTSRAGVLMYPNATTGAIESLNLYSYLASKGINTAADPTIAKLLSDINTASKTAGTLSTYDSSANTYTYIPQATQKRKFPTVRMDFNVTAAHRLTFNYRYNDFNANPDFLNTAEARFPGFPNQGGQVSGRYMYQVALRSTFGKNVVNEIHGGATDARGKGTFFGYGVTPDQFNCTGLGCQSINGLGYSFGIDAFHSITSASAYNSSQAGVASVKSVEDTLTWLKGKHTISAGMSWARTRMRNWGMTPTTASISFSVSSVQNAQGAYLDPAYAPLQQTTLKAAGYNMDSTWAGYASSLYAVLTGRVTSYGGTFYLGNDGKYHFNGERTNAAVGDDWGSFVQDQWSVKPNLTVTAGVRYQLQLPMTTDGLYSRPVDWQSVYGITGAGSGFLGSGNLYHPGTITNPTYQAQLVPYENDRPAYNTDYNNLAPSIGVAWRPQVKNSLLAKITSNEPVIRAGYSLTYSKLGTNFFDSNYSGNPGRSRTGTRSTTAGVPLLGAENGAQTLPVLLQNIGTFGYGNTAIPASPTYPIIPAITESLDIHYPNWPTPMTHQWSAGFQRELGKSTAIEVRYVGNMNVGGWTTWDMAGSSSQWSLLDNENGFLTEFNKARANLHANIVAGKGNTFAYTGAPGTSPLPIFMAYYQGIPLSNTTVNQDPTKYTASYFSSSSYYGNLGQYSASWSALAGTGTAGFSNPNNATFISNIAKAGLPANFFIANPAVADAYLETTGGNTKYNSIQLELRRRMGGGLLVQGSYSQQFLRKTWNQRSLREDWFYQDSTGGADKTFKASWVYELPFGQGKRLGGNVSRWTNMAIGGWEFDGVARIQSGAAFNFGGYRLVGMTAQDLQDMFKVRKEYDASGVLRIYMLPKDVIEQSRIALTQQSATTVSGFSGASPTGRYLATATGPDCFNWQTATCPGTVLTRKIVGPMYWKVDFSLVKRIVVGKNMRVEARMDLFNVFDSVNFVAVGVGGSSLTSWEITSGQTDTNGSQDPGGRITSFGLRFSW